MLQYHNELHRYVRVVQTAVTFQLVLGDVQDRVRCLPGLGAGVSRWF